MQSAAGVGRTASELETEKASALKAFIAAKGDAVREGVEKQIEILDKQIKSAQTERNGLEVSGSDIEILSKSFLGTLVWVTREGLSDWVMRVLPSYI